MGLTAGAATLCALLLAATAGPPPCDLSGYRPQPGLEAVAESDGLTVRWDGEQGQELRARFAVVDGTPTIHELAVRKQGGEWKTPGAEPRAGVRRDDRGAPDRSRACPRRTAGTFSGTHP